MTETTIRAPADIEADEVVLTRNEAYIALLAFADFYFFSYAEGETRSANEWAQGFTETLCGASLVHTKRANGG